jgi:hypothetical protein
VFAAVSASFDQIRSNNAISRFLKLSFVLVLIPSSSPTCLFIYLPLFVQVFFNLQSLPEIILLALHTTVKQTIEMSRAALDLDALVATYPELVSQAAPNTSTSTVAGLSLGASKRAAAAAAVAAGPQPLPVSSQLRMALREAAHQWSALVFEQAMQIHVLQRVVAKKEDPSTHVRFIDVLRAAGNASNNPVLASGRLLELYWNQLCMGLQDVAAEKLRAQPHAASRIYPFLRKAAVDIVENLKALSNRDLNRDAQIGIGFSGLVGFTGVDADLFEAGSTNAASGSAPATSGEGVFGSLSWSAGGDLLGSLGMGSRRSGMRAGGVLLPRTGAVHVTEGGTIAITTGSSGRSKDRDRDREDRRRAVIEDVSAGEADEASRVAALMAATDSGLVGGLKPLRDRYLAGALSRMNAPVNQMFPEMEGYTGMYGHGRTED